MTVRRTPYSSPPAEPITDPRSLRWWWVPDAGFAAFRVAIGLLLAWHGIQELSGALLLPGQVWTGPHVPLSDPWLLGMLKLLGGVLLCLGLFTQSSAIVLAVLVALTHWVRNGRSHWMLNGGELVTVYCIVLTTLALTGAGAFSIDAILRGRRSRRKTPGMTVPLSPWIRRQARRRELTR